MPAFSRRTAAELDPETVPVQRQIGILGGMSDQSTHEYYRIINQEINNRLGGWHTGEIVITSADFAIIEYCVRNALWPEVCDYLRPKVRTLVAAGADILVCASNTMHRAAVPLFSEVDVPFIHISDPTGRAIRQAGLKKVAILGTLQTMEPSEISRRLEDEFGIGVVYPEEDDKQVIDSIIFDELVKGNICPDSKARMLDIVDKLSEREIDCLALSCTEICLLINQDDRPSIPMFDTTLLHALAAVDFAISK